MHELIPVCRQFKIFCTNSLSALIEMWLSSVQGSTIKSFEQN